MMRKNRRGQVTAEIAVLFTFVIAALVFMGTYIQRGSQGSVKGNVDSIGQQYSTANAWSSRSESRQHQDGATVTSGQCAEYAHTTSGSSVAVAACKDLAPNPEGGFADPGGKIGP